MKEMSKKLGYVGNVHSLIWRKILREGVKMKKKYFYVFFWLNEEEVIAKDERIFHFPSSSLDNWQL